MNFSDLNQAHQEGLGKLKELNPPGFPLGVLDNVPQLVSKSPLTNLALANLNKEEKDLRNSQLDVYKQQLKIQPGPPGEEIKVSIPDACGYDFFDKLDVSMNNFMDLITAVDGAGLNLSTEISKITQQVTDTASGFVSQMSSALAEGMVGFVKTGLQAIADTIFALFASAGLPRLAAIPVITEIQAALIKPVHSLTKGIGCLAKKVMNGLGDTIKDLITGMVKNVTAVPACAIQEFAGAIAGKITSAMDSLISPLINPISNSLGVFGIGSLFDVKNFLSGGIDTLRKGAGLFSCGGGNKCASSTKYTIGGGRNKSKSGAENDSFLNKAISLGSQMTDGVTDKLGDFEDAYGRWSIFGNEVGTPDGLEKCNTSNMFNCGAPKVEFFGGDGSGGAGEVILGKFMDHFDKDDLFGSFQQTASIIGVNITDPGAGYTDAPIIAFVDNCNQGYGGYGRAKIDYNMNSPTYGQITDIVIVSEGEGYPVNTTKPKQVYIGKVIVENGGIGYSQDDDVDDDNLKLIVDDGQVVGVEIVNQTPYVSLPKINILTSTGRGAIIKPVMSLERSTREFRLLQVIDCIAPKENLQIIDTGETIVI